jgi:MFS family permease
MKETMRIYLILRFLTGFGFSLEGATYVIFLQEHGLNDFQVNLMNVVCWIAMFLFQVPTGLVADVFGRKLSFLISCFFQCLGGIVYGFSETMLGFASAEIILALGMTFSSGAFDAWAVDRLKEYGYEGPQSRISSQATFVTYIAMIIGGFIGGVLGSADLRFPWFALAGMLGLSGVYALFAMKETRGFDAHRGLEKWQQFIKTFHSSLRYLRGAKDLHFVIVVDAVAVFAMQPLNMYWQNIFKEMFASTWVLGPIKSGISAACLLGAVLVMRFGSGKDPKRSMLSLLLATGVFVIFCCLFIDTTVLLLPFMLHEFTRGCYEPIKNAYLQEHLPDAERATIASMVSMIIAFMGALGLFVSGLIAEYVSIPTSWFVSGLCFIFVTFYYVRNKR